MCFETPGLDDLVCEVQLVHGAMMLIREDLGAHESYAETRFFAELLQSRGCVAATLPWSVARPAPRVERAAAPLQPGQVEDMEGRRNIE